MKAFMFYNIKTMLFEPFGLERMLFEPFGLGYRKDTFVWRNTYLSVPLLMQCLLRLSQGSQGPA